MTPIRNGGRAALGVVMAAMVLLAVGPASAAEVLGKGTFVGKSGHTVSGTVTIVKTAKGIEARLGSDFSLDNAPGPWLGFGNGGRYDKASQFSRLGNKTGAQTYKLPARIDVSKYKEFYVWCRPFGVPLGVAKIR